MSIEIITDGIIDIIKKNIIAKTNVTADVTTGDIVVNIVNAYRFNADEEIVLIDWDYNDADSPHYHIYEYAKIKTVNNTHAITLQNAVVGDWTLANNSFVQKTIGHSPLYEDNVLYGDREVIPVDDIAITVEPVSLSNDWIYIQGGLNEEYRIRIMIYGKDIDVDEGRRILDRYSYSVYDLLNNNIHLDVNNYSTPLIHSYVANSSSVVISDTEKNREEFIVTVGEVADYQLQDNLGVSCWFKITNVSQGGGLLHLTIAKTFDTTFELSEYAVITKIGRYIYDSRADNVEFGKVAKGSAFLRAAEINWFGKRVYEHTFPQTSDGVDNFVVIEDNDSSSSSSSN